MNDDVKRALAAVLHSDRLPAWASTALQHALDIGSLDAAEVTVREHRFEASYLEFLDTQIALDARGPEWVDLLKARKAALSGSVDETLLRVGVRRGNEEVVAHWRARDGELVHVEIT
jgi:hypothetical protein